MNSKEENSKTIVCISNKNSASVHGLSDGHIETICTVENRKGIREHLL